MPNPEQSALIVMVFASLMTAANYILAGSHKDDPYYPIMTYIWTSTALLAATTFVFIR